MDEKWQQGTRVRLFGGRGFPINENMTRFAVRVLLSAAALAFLAHAPTVFSPEGIEDKVAGTQLTHRDMHKAIGGCAGTLKLERKAGDQAAELAINVPLGTPITRGTETVYLPAVRGKTVAIAQVTEKNERVAKAIEPNK